MRLWAAIVVAGCGFSAPASSPGGDDKPIDAPAVVDDAPAMQIDAPQMTIDAAIDAPCQDDDSDGVCNTADLWPCGPQPTMPGNAVTWDTQNGQNQHQTITLTGTSLSGTKLRVVAPNATFTVAAGYSISDCICTGCIDQIQVGLVPGNLKKCVYDANPACTPASTGNGMVTLTAPATPGVYDVRFRLGQDYECDGTNNDHLGWWVGMAPDAAQTVAKVCVH